MERPSCWPTTVTWSWPRARFSLWGPRPSSSNMANTERRRSSASILSTERPRAKWPCLFARPLCRWTRSWIPPVQAIRLRVASSDTSPLSRRSHCRPSSTPCSTVASWAPLPLSASVRNGCNRSRERRSINASLSFVSSRTLTEERSASEAIRRETILVAWAALAAALGSLAYCARHGMLLLYGDAVAHLHIARRVFDSITPGFRQLGSVWLPLPHILLLPFVWNMAWWRSGLAGACVSIPSYVLGCAGIYRLARIWLGRPAALGGVPFYGLNPGLLYMATTAMTEPLFLAEMIWALVLIVLFERTLESGLLIGAGLVLVCAVFTRYDGCIYAAVAWLFVTVPMFWDRRRWQGKPAGAWVFFTAMLIAAPALGLAP